MSTRWLFAVLAVVASAALAACAGEPVGPEYDPDRPEGRAAANQGDDDDDAAATDDDSAADDDNSGDDDAASGDDDTAGDDDDNSADRCGGAVVLNGLVERADTITNLPDDAGDGAFQGTLYVALWDNPDAEGFPFAIKSYEDVDLSNPDDAATFCFGTDGDENEALLEGGVSVYVDVLLDADMSGDNSSGDLQNKQLVEAKLPDKGTKTVSVKLDRAVK